MIRVLVLAPMLLALVAEAAWCAVVAGLLQAFVLREPAPGVIPMLLAALAGVLAVRTLAPRTATRWPSVAVGLAVATGAAGWLASPDVRDILLGRVPGGIPDALVAAPGGWIAGVAFVRGIAHAHVPPDPRTIGTALGIGIPGLAVAAILGGMVAEPWRSDFLSAAQVDVVLFLVAGILALALARLALVGSGATVDWRRNPAWVWLLLVLLAGVAGAAVAASLVAGPMIAMVLGAAVPSLLLLGLVVGFDRRSLRILAISAALALLVGSILRALGARPGGGGGAAPGTGISTPGSPAVTTPLAIGIIALVVVAAVAAALILIRLWMRRPRAAEDDLLELRWIDRGDVSARGGDRRRPRGLRLGRPAPTDAVGAYRALLEAVDPVPVVRREPGETPAEHAARLRDGGLGGLSLDLLAADYGLVRFGGVALTAVEDRRAVRRSSLLRRRLLAATKAPRSRSGGGPGADERPGAEGATGERAGARSRFRVG